MSTNSLLREIANQNQIGGRYPVIKNVMLTDARREYAYTFPAGTIRYAFKCRGDVGDATSDLRYAWQTGRVAPPNGVVGNPTSDYDVLPVAAEESEVVFFEIPTTIYFSSAQASIVLSIRYWTNSA